MRKIILKLIYGKHNNPVTLRWILSSWFFNILGIFIEKKNNHGVWVMKNEYFCNLWNNYEIKVDKTKTLYWKLKYEYKQYKE